MANKSEYNPLKGRKALLNACQKTPSGSNHVLVPGQVVNQLLLLLEDVDPELNPAADGVGLIAAERQEQIYKHGWDTARDADYGKGELMQAAATCLALYSNNASAEMAAVNVGGNADPRNMWPWQSEFGKSFYYKIEAKAQVDKLKVAGALIAAEIDRLQAADQTAKGGQPNV